MQWADQNGIGLTAHRRTQWLGVVAALLAGFSAGPAARQTAPAPEPAAGAVQHVHDPCLIRDGDAYYVFSTGPGVPVRRSRDLAHWEVVGRVFEEDVPSWARKEIPEGRAIWAPDISRHAGRFWLYYCVSSFGRNRSVIGCATNVTLDAARPDYRWVDQGEVYESTARDDFNAIDPNVLWEAQPRPVLTFGSFWSGIKAIPLDTRTGRPAPATEPVSLARRSPPDAIEAPFLIRRGRYYYLFVSFDYCCRGVNSTYNIRVGRAERAEGPYLDREGTALTGGGGTPLLATRGDVIGPGHCAALRDGGRDYLVFHFYDGKQNGIPTLQVRPIRWSPDGWPAVDVR